MINLTFNMQDFKGRMRKIRLFIVKFHVSQFHCFAVSLLRCLSLLGLLFHYVLAFVFCFFLIRYTLYISFIITVPLSRCFASGMDSIASLSISLSHYFPWPLCFAFPLTQSLSLTHSLTHSLTP